MALSRPTMQGRKGFDPMGYGPGVNAPYGYSKTYPGKHNGQDYFWLGAASAKRLGISTAASKNVYPILDGTVHPTSSGALGGGAYQQVASGLRVYYWHLAKRIYGSAKTLTTRDRLGVMGHTGTAAGNDDHLHLEFRKAPYGFADRVDPEPYFLAKPISDADKAQYKKIGAYLNVHAINLSLPRTTTAYDGVPGVNYWKLVQALGRAWKFYSGAVDGVPGALTFAAERHVWSSFVRVPDPVVLPVAVPVVDVPVVVIPDPVVDPVAEPVVEPVVEPVPEPVEEPAPEPVEPKPTPKPTPTGHGWITATIITALATLLATLATIIN